MRYFLPAYPSLRLLVCAVAGIVAAISLPIAPFAWLAAALVACVVTGILLLAGSKHPPFGRLSLFAALCYLTAIFSGFAFHASAAFRFAPSPSLLEWVGRDVILSGLIDGRPNDDDGVTTMQLRVTEVFENGRKTRISDRAKVVVRMPRNEDARFQEGDFVRVKGRVGLIPVASNRGEYDPRWQQRLKGIHVQIFCAGPWKVLREPPKPGFSFIRNVVNPLRNYLTEALDTHVPDGEERQFVKGMILGERDMLSAELNDAFRRTGTAHVLAVSGLHVALLAYAVNLCLQRLKVTPAGRWVAMLLLVSIITLYSFVTGNAPSIKRAAIMSAMLFAGGALGRKSYAVNSLAASDLLILLLDPFDLFNPGFVMTNGAVLGILTLYPPLAALVPESKKLHLKLMRLAWEAFAVSLSAMIGVSPVIALYFGTFSVSGIVANLPAVLFSNFAMYAALPVFLFHGLGGWIASFFGTTTLLFARLTLYFVHFFSSMPYASIAVRPDSFEVAVFYFTIALLFYAVSKKTWGRVAIAVLSGANLLLWHEAMRPPPKPPGMVTVNLGKEMAVLFSSGSETCLVDAGRRESGWERIQFQTESWGLRAPVTAAGIFTPDSLMRRLPLSVLPSGSGSSARRMLVVRKLDDKALRIDSRARSLLLVSGMKRLEAQRADGADVVFWIHRFTGKEWRRLDAWIATARPRRMLLVPGPFMSAEQRELLRRYASARPGVEVRSKNKQTAWY